MRKKAVKKLALSKETLAPLEQWSLYRVAGLSPGSRTLNCETYLYPTCPTYVPPPK